MIQAFEEISTTSYDDYGRRAKGYWLSFRNFKSIKLCYLVFAVTEEVSLLLAGQKHNSGRRIATGRYCIYD